MRGYAAIGCNNTKSPENMGSILRAAGCYKAAMVAFSGPRPARLKLNKWITDPQKNYRHIPTLWPNDLHEIIPCDCVPIAVDLTDDAISIIDYKHPERAFYIFGAEDMTLGSETTSWCRETIYIPTNRCMNLAATVKLMVFIQSTSDRRSNISASPVEMKRPCCIIVLSIFYFS